MVLKRVDLLNALKRLKFAIRYETVLPVILNLYMRVSEKDGAVYFTATDLNLSITEKIIASSVSKDKELLIDFYWLYNIISNTIADLININDDKGDFTIRCGKSKHSIAPDDRVGEYPRIPEMVNQEKTVLKFTQDTKEFSAAMVNALKCIGHDDLRPAMCGVYLDKREEGLVLVTTDAHRLYVSDVVLNPNYSLINFNGSIIDFSTSKFLAKNKMGECQIWVSENLIQFSNERTTVISRLIDARYPDYKVVLDTHKGDYFLEFDRKQFSLDLKCASALSNPSTKQVSLMVKQNRGEVRMKVAVDFDGGMSTFEIECKEEGVLHLDEMEIGFNSKFFLEILSMSKAKTFKLRLNTPRRGMFIDENVLLMPLMLNDSL